MKHCIIVKFVDGFDWRSCLDDIKNIFSQALEIDGVTKIDYLLTNTDIENRSHLVIVMSMKDKNALNVFKESECHKYWKQKYTEHILTKAIFDYDD